MVFLASNLDVKVRGQRPRFYGIEQRPNCLSCLPSVSGVDPVYPVKNIWNSETVKLSQ